MRRAGALALTLAAMIASHALEARPVRRAAPGAAAGWAAMASATPDGAYVLGNPKAQVRLVEYASLTCSHCAAFAAEGWPKLQPYIRSGRLALEVRTAVRDRFDLAATLLARCQGPRAYFGNAELLFAHQAEWGPRAQQWEQDNQAALQTMPPADALAAAAHGAGFDALLGPRGLSPVAIKACFADAGAQRTIAAMASEAWDKRQIGGTPAFFINDIAVDVHDWAGLAPLIADAVR